MKFSFWHFNCGTSKPEFIKILVMVNVTYAYTKQILGTIQSGKSVDIVVNKCGASPPKHFLDETMIQRGQGRAG